MAGSIEMNVLAGNATVPAIAQPAVVAQAQTTPVHGTSLALVHWLHQLEDGEQKEAASVLENTVALEGMHEEALQGPLEEGDVTVSGVQEIDAFTAFAPVLWSTAEPMKVSSAASSANARVTFASDFQVDGLQTGSQEVLRMMAVPSTKMQAQPGEMVELNMAAAEWSHGDTTALALQSAAKSERLASHANSVAPLLSVPVNKGEQPLVQALAQKIQYQQLQGAEVATVRLDPPQMGSLEIRIRHDATGGVHVQMQASNAEVGRQLSTLVETLRQELQQRSADVQVTVASSRNTGSHSGQGNPAREQAASEQETAIGQALQDWDGQALT